MRTRQISFFTYAGYLVIFGVITDIKAWLVRRMFWGRSSLYRTTFHLMVSFITIIIVLSGISSRLNLFASEAEGLDLNSGILGRKDILSQSGTAESIGVIGVDEKDYPVYLHKVERGQSLSEIAKLYQINETTIKWANNLNSNTLQVDMVLRIPGIDGAFIKVKAGDTLEGIATRYKGTVADIIDLNSDVINPRDPKISEGMELFIPNGVIPTPPPVVRTPYRPPNQPVGDPGGVNVPPGTFVHPLGTDPNCAGWSWSRGFSAWHGGADMAKGGGCWINAAGNGTVTRAGWRNDGSGYAVVIQHDNGIKTLYYHGTGQFAVQVGDNVKAGQKIMYMGSTGNSTGTHLHFEFRINDVKVNPETYVGLR